MTIFRIIVFCSFMGCFSGVNQGNCNNTSCVFGTCQDRRCVCNTGWTGSDCATAICNLSCINGDCIPPDTCNCSEGWNSSTCLEAICISPCINGNCSQPVNCTCNPGWSGTSCTEAMCDPECDNGYCISPGNCNCSEGWNGSTCSEAVCNPPCANGDCISPDTCNCSEGWNSSTCSEAVCDPPCGYGDCVSPDICSCSEGWNGSACYEDINECMNGSNICDQICINTNGSYTCDCHSGYVLGNDSYSCEDIDECTEKSYNCSHICINTNGSYTCDCYSGYVLGYDSYSCEDIDECIQKSYNCDHICINTNGTYICDCYSGFTLDADGYFCTGQILYISAGASLALVLIIIIVPVTVVLILHHRRKRKYRLSKPRTHKQRKLLQETKLNNSGADKILTSTKSRNSKIMQHRNGTAASSVEHNNLKLSSKVPMIPPNNNLTVTQEVKKEERHAASNVVSHHRNSYELEDFNLQVKRSSQANVKKPLMPHNKKKNIEVDKSNTETNGNQNISSTPQAMPPKPAASLSNKKSESKRIECDSDSSPATNQSGIKSDYSSVSSNPTAGTKLKKPMLPPTIIRERERVQTEMSKGARAGEDNQETGRHRYSEQNLSKSISVPSKRKLESKRNSSITISSNPLFTTGEPKSQSTEVLSSSKEKSCSYSSPSQPVQGQHHTSKVVSESNLKRVKINKKQTRPQSDFSESSAMPTICAKPEKLKKPNCAVPVAVCTDKTESRKTKTKHTNEATAPKSQVTSNNLSSSSTPAFRMDNPTYDGLDVHAIKILHNPTYDAEIQCAKPASASSGRQKGRNQAIKEEVHEYDYPSITVFRKQRPPSPTHIYEPVEDNEPVDAHGRMHSPAVGGFKKVHDNNEPSKKKKPMKPPSTRRDKKQTNETALHYAVTPILDASMLTSGNKKKQIMESTNKASDHVYAILEPGEVQDTVIPPSQVGAKTEHDYAVLERPHTSGDEDGGNPAIENDITLIADHYEVSSKYLDSLSKLQ